MCLMAQLLFTHSVFGNIDDLQYIDLISMGDQTQIHVHRKAGTIRPLTVGAVAVTSH